MAIMKHASGSFGARAGNAPKINFACDIFIESSAAAEETELIAVLGC